MATRVIGYNGLEISVVTTIQNIIPTITVADDFFESIATNCAIAYIINIDTRVAIDAIIAAKNRGVTVRVITEEDYDFEEIADILHNNGIPIVWQDSRWFTANHNKGIIVDGRMVLISSINYSEGSITRNREAGVIIENKDVAQWYLEVYDFDWSIGDCDVMNDVNVYWTPNIPTNASDVNVTVYGHMLYGDTIDEVELDVKIGDGAWSNITITANVSLSAEGDEENFFYVIPAQPDGTNITVVGRIRVDSTWHTGIPLGLQ